MKPSEPSDRINWLEARNVGDEALQAYGLCAIVGLETVTEYDESKGVTRTYQVLNVDKPQVDSQGNLYVVGLVPIQPAEIGSIHNTFPCAVAYMEIVDGDAPNNGDVWGALADFTQLFPGQSGFVILGGGRDGLIDVDRVPVAPIPAIILGTNGTGFTWQRIDLANNPAAEFADPVQTYDSAGNISNPGSPVPTAEDFPGPKGPSADTYPGSSYGARVLMWPFIDTSDGEYTAKYYFEYVPPTSGTLQTYVPAGGCLWCGAWPGSGGESPPQVSAVGDNGGAVQVTTGSPHGLTTGDQIVLGQGGALGGLAPWGAPQGTYAVTVDSSTQITLQGTTYASGGSFTDPALYLGPKTNYQVPFINVVNLNGGNGVITGIDIGAANLLDDILILTSNNATTSTKILNDGAAGKGLPIITPNHIDWILPSFGAVALTGAGEDFSGGAFAILGLPIPTPITEVPTGTIDGSNDTFALTQSPWIDGSLQLFLYTTTQIPATDYTMPDMDVIPQGALGSITTMQLLPSGSVSLVGSTITITPPTIHQSLIAHYEYLNPTNHPTL